jgi:hypothetical protein
VNRAQKIAWFNLKVVAVTVPVSLVIVLVSLLSEGLVVALIGGFILGVAALIMGLAPLLFRKEPNRVNYDERDAVIEKQVHLIGYCTLWCIFIATCMIAAFPAGPAILAVTLVIVKVVESVAILVHYGRGDKNARQ